MNRDKRRLIALLLCISMMAGPVSHIASYAEEPENAAPVTQETQTTLPDTGATQEITQTETLTEEAAETMTPSEETRSVDGTEPSSGEPRSVDGTEPSSEEAQSVDGTEPSSEDAQSVDGTEPSSEEAQSVDGTEPSSDETQSVDETEPSSGENTDALEAAAEETEPSEEAELDVTYPWDEMTDEEFALFIRQEQYLLYEGDPDAQMSLLERAEEVEEEQLRDELCIILILWLFPEEAVAEVATFSTGAGQVTLEELNGSDMFFKQEGGGTCTLAANAMLVRRAARLNGYSDWRNITESAIRGTAWIDGVGMCWNYTYAGITVGHGYFESCSVETFLAFLKQHPEGFVAYNANRPHAVLITDYDEATGTFYCADPGFANWRMPLSESILYSGSQESTIASFTAYWAVTSPKLSVATNRPPVSEREITVSAVMSEEGGVDVSWNDTDAAGYWIYRSEDPSGPWDTPIYTAPAGCRFWTDESAEMLKTYYYCVRSFDAKGADGYLSEAVECALNRNAERIGEGTCGNNIRWAAYEDGILLVAGSGPMPNYSNEVEEPWIRIRSQIREVYLSGGITAVGSSNFGGCPNLTRVSLPSTVKSIGDWAFRGCSSLTQIDMPGVTSIGYAAFRHCTALQELEIPDAVTTIGAWAFSKCTSLERIVLPAGLTAIGDALFYEADALHSVQIPAGVKSIGAHAFRGCKALADVTIPSSVTQISSYAFALCSSLGDLDLSGCTGGLTLGEGAFYNCTGITRLTLPTCRAEASAFAYCYGLRYVTLSQRAGSSTLGDYAFRYCVNLSRMMVLGAGMNTSSTTFQNTAAMILVDRAYYGDLNDTIGTCLWTSYQSAGSCTNGVCWYVNSDSALVICGGGAIPSYSASGAPWSGKTVKKVLVEGSITGIGSNGFSGLSQIEDIYFLGSAPSFDAAALAGISCNVRFHNTDGSWTGVIGGSYGGSPKWVENHSYSWKLTKAPGFASGGEMIGTCSVCGNVDTVQVPKLDKESYDYTEGETTCRYTWKVTDYGKISFEVRLVAIQTQPVSAAVGAGEQAQFSVTASGNALRYQWQWCNDDWGTWNDCDSSFPGAQTATLTVTNTAASQNGCRFRCIISDGNGKSVTTQIVTLTVK